MSELNLYSSLLITSSHLSLEVIYLKATTPTFQWMPSNPETSAGRPPHGGTVPRRGETTAGWDPASWGAAGAFGLHLGWCWMEYYIYNWDQKDTYDIYIYIIRIIVYDIYIYVYVYGISLGYIIGIYHWDISLGYIIGVYIYNYTH